MVFGFGYKAKRLLEDLDELEKVIPIVKRIILRSEEDGTISVSERVYFNVENLVGLCKNIGRHGYKVIKFCSIEKINFMDKKRLDWTNNHTNSFWNIFILIL